MKRYHQLLKGLLAKSVSLNGIPFVPPSGGNPLDLGESVKTFLTQALQSADPGEVAKFIKRAHEGGAEEMASLNALRIEQISNFILPTTNVASRFFAVQNLQENERPAVQVNTMQETTATYIGADGDVRSVKIQPNQTETLIDLYTLWSEEVIYRLRDLYAGNIEENALKTVDIAFDMAIKLDQLAFTLLGTAFGAFTTSGAKSARTFVPHSAIDPANIPSTNSIVLSGNTSSTKFREAVFKAVLEYCDTWADSFPDGDLRPTGDILVPSSETTHVLDSVSYTGSTSNSVADGILQNYTTVPYGGITWRMIPSNRLPKKVCYPILNKPVGTLYFKPSMDESYDNGGEPEARRKNQGRRSAMKVIGMYIPRPKTVNALRVRYTT